ncbi:MAG: polyphosphate kinase 2 family protein [Deltaproteobacteria bacterium]|nr:polyphosphate kinase 2 family protein [Deltaproteobacteria bacterium]
MSRDKKKAKKTKKKSSNSEQSIADLLRVGADFSLASFDPDRVIAGPADSSSAREAALALEPEVSNLHERLWAQAKGGGKKSVLIIVQGMDTSGKGGVGKAIDRLLDPLGFGVVGFGPPTDEEKAHHFLWRHIKALPESGRIRMFDRSHYEAVLVERVRGYAPKKVWSKRYDEINAWEATLAERETTVIKLMLHISLDEQKRRLTDRINTPDKHWKYNPGDLDERAFWDDYMAAYQEALTRCSTEVAPWYVIPANHKWHRDWLISQILVETLRKINPQYPPASFDVEAERKRVEAL